MAGGVKAERRRARLSAWTGALIVALIVVTANYVLSVVPVRVDTSAGRAYSISKATKDVLSQLEDTLLVRVVFSRELPPVYKINERYLTDLLAEYKRASNGRIRVEYFDPGASPKTRELAIDYGVLPIQLDVMERDRREVAERFMGVAFFYGDQTEAIPFVQDVENLEYEITLRVKKLVQPAKPVIAFIENSMGVTIDSPALQALRRPLNELYDVRTVNLSTAIPSDVRAVWWIAPRDTPLPFEIQNLVSFFKSGGSVGLMVDTYDVVAAQFRTSPVVANHDLLLSEFGISVSTGFVVDPRCDRIQIRAMQGPVQLVNVVDYPYFPLVTALDRSHPASRGIDAISMPFVSPLDFKDGKPGLTYTAIADSSHLSYLESEPMMVSPLDDRIRPPDARGGPFHLAVLAEGKLEGASAPGRVVAFGTSRFIRPEFPARQSNYALFFNFIDWLAQDDALLGIRSKGFARRPLRQLSDGARSAWKAALALFLPFATVVFGLTVWRLERRRRARLAAAYRTAP